MVGGIIFRNLARADLQYHKDYKWRVKRTIRFIQVRHMVYRIIVVFVAVLGATGQWWPPLLCFVLSVYMMGYFFKFMPFVNMWYNQIRIALYSIVAWSFLIAFMSSAFNSEDNIVVSILIFLFPIVGLLAYFIAA